MALRTNLSDLAERVRSRLGGARAPAPTRRSRKRAPEPTGSDGDRPGGVVIAYSPDHDGEPDPGEVVWTWVAYEDDPTQGKDRPVLILGHDGPLLVGVQLSSKDHRGRGDAHDWLPVGRGAWDAEGRPSFADASRLLRIEPTVVRREGAAIDRARFDEVVAHAGRLHGWSG